MQSHSTAWRPEPPTSYCDDATLFEVRGADDPQGSVFERHCDAVEFAAESGEVDLQILHWQGGEVILREDALEYIHLGEGGGR